MAELPIGTVTFLPTDIEGSTSLLHVLSDRHPDGRILLTAVPGRREVRECIVSHLTGARSPMAARFVSRGRARHA